MTEAHTNNGGYDLKGVIWHQHSNRLLVEIMKYFSKEIPVIDMGCGHNFYVSVLKYAGWYLAVGWDMVDLGSKNFSKQDLTEPFENATIGPCNIISLEVGEHIPKEKAQIYLDNISQFKGDVIMSWALPGQAGVGHINCQSNEWVISEMTKRGFKIDQIKTDSLREAMKDCHCSWFRNTLMYFSCE